MSAFSSRRRLLGFAALLAVSVYAAILLMGIGRGIDEKYQWDFKSHYCAARVYEQGLNFYDEPYLRHYCSLDASQYYSYTPLSIWFFRFFALFPYATAYDLFFALKLLALACLFVIWAMVFLEAEADVWFFVFALLAFNGAMYLDLRTGNVSLLEQLGLWLGFLFWLKKKPALFGLCVVLAATFKVVPLVFLALLLFSTMRRRWHYFGGSLLAFAVLHGLSFALNPFLFKEFLRVFLTMLRETRGIINPSMFVWLQDVVNSIWGAVRGGAAPRLLTYGLFAALAAVIMVLTFRALSRFRGHPGRDQEKATIYLFCLAYALLMPRFKDYCYVLLLVPAYFALKNYAAGLGRVLLFGLAILSVAENTSLPGFDVIFRYLWEYFPLYAAVALWSLYIRRAVRPPDVYRSADLPSLP